MKLAEHMICGTFLKRYKRFMVDIALPDGGVQTVHCANTGSMKGCLEPGALCWCSDSENDKRKYRYTLEVIELPDGARIYVNPVKVNRVVEEALRAGKIPALAMYDSVFSEVKYGEENSRIDFMLQAQDQPDCYIEVKNVTLLESDPPGPGIGCFPDAVSTRGQKHLRELMAVRQAGYRAVLLFCVSHTGIDEVWPADHIDPTYGQLLRDAVKAGVEVMAWRCAIAPNEVELAGALRFRLPHQGVR